MGQLAAGVAHEINTPIQYISGNIDFIGRILTNITDLLTSFANAVEAPPGESELQLEKAAAAWHAFETSGMVTELSDAISDSKTGTLQIAEIVQAMKRFSHPGSERKELVDLNVCIQNAAIVSRNEWKYCSSLTTDLSPDLPLLQGYPGDINQLLLNVIVNAAHANALKHADGRHTGQIHVSTRHDDGRIVLRIQDNGTGIPKAIQEKIFDPFFTTKQVGQGTGQGLAIVHSIVSKHGGTISFTSNEDEGATFEIEFPAESGSIQTTHEESEIRP